MELRPLQVHRESEDVCLNRIHVSVLVSSRAQPVNSCIFVFPVPIRMIMSASQIILHRIYPNCL